MARMWTPDEHKWDRRLTPSELVEIGAAAITYAPEHHQVMYSAKVKRPTFELSMEPGDEFLEKLDGVDPTDIAEIGMWINSKPASIEPPLLVMLTVRQDTRLTVRGTNHDAVFGARERLQHAVEARLRKCSMDRARALDSRNSPMPKLPQAPPGPKSPDAQKPSAWRRVLNHPWVIGIGAASIGGVVAGLILALK